MSTPETSEPHSPVQITAAASSPEAHEMSLLDHLGELRKRLLYSALAIFIGAIFAYCYTQELFALLNAPFKAAFADKSLIGTGPAEAFMMRLKVSFFAGCVLSCPFLFSQLWLFVSPGLYAEERRMLIPFVFATSVLFLVGAAFCHQTILPLSYEFFKAEYQNIGVEPAIKINEHLSLAVTCILGFGAVFEMPVIAFFMGRAGIIDHHSLIDSGRYAIIAIFILAAVLTPPDVLSQFLMAGPLLVLYGISIVLVKYTARPRVSAEE